jgi:hypothetical protein
VRAGCGRGPSPTIARVPPRVFISYRAADGAIKATALARDLGRVFGDDQVFLDKDDLRGGSHWVQEVGRALDTRPVLLLLVTPAMFEATDADGRRRIDDPQDPVRLEVDGALAAGATLIPVLGDGVDALPAGLPPPLDTLGERTWRRLRAYDWAADLQRLVDDLLALGVAPRSAGPRRLPRRSLALAGAALAVLAAAAGAWWWPWTSSEPRLDGRWLAQMGDDRVTVEIRIDGERLTLESHPIDIRERADWADYRAFWRGRFGSELDAVRYRGAGRWQRPAGSPAGIDVGLRIVSVPGDADIDGGNLTATLGPDGRLQGSRWLNGAQAEVPATLERGR